MRVLFLLPLLSLFSLPTLPAADTSTARFAVTDLGAISGVDGSVGALALNDQRQVVGGDSHALLWDKGREYDLGVLPPGPPEDDISSTAYGINNQSQIVGGSGGFGPIFMSGLQFERGFLFQKGTLRQLTQEGASFEPRAINDKGQIVGLDAYRGFLYQNGRLLLLGTLSHVPVGNRSAARAINNSGQIVGWSTVNSLRRVTARELTTHACLWRTSGKAVRQRDLGTLPSWVNSYAYGINDRGEVIGSVSDTTGGTYGVSPNAHARAFLWRGGKMTSLGTLPGSHSSEAFGINNAGAVVGQSGGRAFRWQAGHMRNLNSRLPAGSGWVLAEARAVNNRGQIAGNGTFHGKPHAFLLTPR